MNREESIKQIKIWASKIASSLVAFALALAMVPSGALAIQAFAEESESTKNYVCYDKDGNYYTSLQDAIDEIDSYGTIYLTSNVEVDSTITIKGKNVALWLKSNTINTSSNFNGDSLISVDSCNNISIMGGGYIKGSCTNLIYIWESSVNLVGGVKLDGENSATRGIYVCGNGASVSINNGYIYDIDYGIETYKCNPSTNDSNCVTVASSNIDASKYGIYLYMSKGAVSNVDITGEWNGIALVANCGDGGYYTELAATNAEITGTGSSAIYVGESSWYGSGTLKLSLTGCTLSGSNDVGIEAKSYTATFLSDDYSVSYNEDTDIACEQTVWNWTYYYTSHDYVEVEAVSATCAEDGMEAYYTCSRCGKIFNNNYEEVESTDNLVVKATGHNWDNGVWTWADDYSSATVVWTCQNDSSHTYTATATVTSKTTESGETVYTATATGPDGDIVTNTKTVTVNDEENNKNGDEDGNGSGDGSEDENENGDGSEDGNENGDGSEDGDKDGDEDGDEDGDGSEDENKNGDGSEDGNENEDKNGNENGDGSEDGDENGDESEDGDKNGNGSKGEENEPEEKPESKPENEPKGELPEVEKPEDKPKKDLPKDEPEENQPELLPPPEQLPELAPELAPLPDVLPDLPVVPDFEPEEPALPQLPELGQGEPKDEVSPLPELGPEGPEEGLEQPQEQPREKEPAAPAEPVTYTVTYMVGDTVVSTSTYLEGEMATVEYYYGELVKEYEFVGWQKVNEEGDAFEEILEEGSTFAVNENVTLVAVWSEVQVEEPAEPTESEETKETEETLYPYGQGSTYFDGENESELDGGFDIGV